MWLIELEWLTDCLRNLNIMQRPLACYLRDVTHQPLSFSVYTCTSFSQVTPLRITDVLVCSAKKYWSRNFRAVGSWNSGSLIDKIQGSYNSLLLPLNTRWPWQRIRFRLEVLMRERYTVLPGLHFHLVFYIFVVLHFAYISGPFTHAR